MNKIGCFALGMVCGTAFAIWRGGDKNNLASRETRPAPASPHSSRQTADAAHEVQRLWQSGAAGFVERARLARALEQCGPDETAEVARQAAATAATTGQGAELEMLFRAWAEQNPEAAVAFACQLPREHPLRENALLGALHGWAEQNVEGADGWLASQPDARERRQLASGLADRLAGTRPAAAVAIAHDNGVDFPVLQDAFAAWSLADAEAAAAWVENHPAGIARDRLLSAGASKLSEASPDRALDFAEKISGRERQDAALQKIARGWAMRDPQAAVKWLEAQPDPSVRQALQKGCAEGLSEKDPALAASLVSQIRQGSDAGWIAAKVTRKWFESDAEAAKQWAIGLPTDDIKMPAVANIAVAWAKTDPSAALSWFRLATPDARQQDRWLAWAAPALDPQTGAQWASSIQDPGRRDNALGIVIENWARKDPQAALEWVRNSPLPAKVKAGLQNKHDQ